MKEIRKKIIALSSSALLCASMVQFPSISLKADSGKILINEICAKNTTMPSNNGNCYDYVELFNPTGNDINIGGYGLTDNEEKPFRFQFPGGTVLRAGERTVVYLDSKEFSLNGEFTGSFGLSTDGETVTLFTPDGNIADRVSFEKLESDTSYARRYDGADSFAVMSMSPGRDNNNSQMIKKVVEPPVFSAKSGFYDNAFDLKLSSASGTKIYYTLDSSTPTKSSAEYTGNITVSGRSNQNVQQNTKHNEQNITEWQFNDKKGNSATAYGSEFVNDSSDRTYNGGRAFTGHSIINNTEEINSALSGSDKSFTFEAIVKPNSEEPNNVFLSKGDFQICLKTHSNIHGLEFFIFQNGWESVVCDFPQNWAGNWHQIAGVYDKGNISIFIDGQQMNSRTVSNNVAKGNQPLGIGIDTETGRKFNGAVSVARIYSKALSSDELRGQMSTSPRISPYDSSVLAWVDYSDDAFKKDNRENQSNQNNNNNNQNSNNGPASCIVRAIAVDSEGNKSEPACGVYFLGYRGTKSYFQNMKVISIVTDSSNLYDSQKGIFTNFENSGKEWERPANLQLFNGGNYSFEQNVGIRVHGGYTRRFEQKSLNIYARSEYGASTFKYDLFSGNLISEAKDKKIKEFDSFILRNAGNDNGSTRFRDKLNQTLVKDRNFLNQGMEPCVVFLNGEFYGHMEITEKVSPEFIDSHYDTGKKNIVIIKNQQLNEGSEQDLREYRELWNWIKSTDFSNNDNYEELKKKIDIECFADYMSSNIYIGNKDWGGNNVSMWKCTKEKENNAYTDGRWRFIMFDTEYSANMYGHIPANSNTFDQIMNDNSFIADLFKAAMKNDRFKKKFVVSFMETANWNFSTDKVNSLIDNYSQTYKEIVNDTLKLYYNRENFSGEVDNVRSFFNNRNENIIHDMRSALRLSGDIVSLTVNNNSNYGTMKIGTIKTDGPFTCKYFTDYPVRLKAYANDGYAVSGWKLSDGRTINENPVELTLTGSVSAEPIYELLQNQTSNNTEEIFYGDLNDDGNADLTDLSLLSLYLIGVKNFDQSKIKAADIDRNGNTDIIDLAYFKQFICKDEAIYSKIKIGK